MPYSVSLTTGNTLNPDPQLGNFGQPIEEKKGGGIEETPQFLQCPIRRLQVVVSKARQHTVLVQAPCPIALPIQP